MAARPGCGASIRRSNRFRSTRRGGWAAAFLVIPLLVLPAAGRAQDELLINDDRVPRAQFAPRVALGATGALVVCWADGRNGPDTFIDEDIYAMTVRDPLALGSTVNRRLNDDASLAIQGSPDIAASPVGGFFCVWEDSRANNPDIFGSALDSLGLRSTPNLRINDDAGFDVQRNPRVTAVGSDRYLVVWGDQRRGQSDIYASYRNVSGAPLSPNFEVSSDTIGFQGEPAVASDANGLTLVVWLDGREGGSVFGATFDIYGQWLDSAGNLLGANFKINTTFTFQQDASPTVAADPTLGFVVAWIDRRLGTSVDPGDVYAQRYGPDRSLIGTNVLVNDDPRGQNQRIVRAAAGPDSAYLFWEDLRGGIGLDANVEAARVPYDASAAGTNFQVNGSIPGRQGTPSAAWDGRDAFLVAWEDSRNGAADIYAISYLPDGSRRGLDTQLNDDAARNDQWRPRLGRGPGMFLLTWIDRRGGANDLFGQWVAANGGRDGANILLFPESELILAVASNAAVSPDGPALVAAQVTRDSDAGEIRGFYLPTQGSVPTGSFWISDSLPSAQASPIVAARSGEFAAAWIDSRDASPRIYGQRISVGGTRLGVNHPLLLVEPADPPFDLDLAPDPTGGYWLLYGEGATADQRLWIAHLDPALEPDGAATEIAPGASGPKQNPRLAVSEADGRLDIAWQGVNSSGVGAVYQVALSSAGIPLGPVLALGDPAYPGARSHPSIAALDSRTVVTWQEKRDGNWSIWMQVLQGGVNPATGAVRVDQDPGQADQLDPEVGMDVSGHSFFVWADTRSLSSGADILARVIELSSTAVDDVPAPEPDPPPTPPSVMRVGPARPNPFSGTLAVPVEIPPAISSRVRVRVLNAQGALIADLYDGAAPGGRLGVRWDGSDARGRGVASGVYWLVVDAGGERHALRLVHLR